MAKKTLLDTQNTLPQGQNHIKLTPQNSSHLPVLSAHNHYYGANELRKQTLFDINLDIYSGEIVIMTGPSGSGKTTLLTLMGGLRSLQSEPQNFGRRRCVVPVSGN